MIDIQTRVIVCKIILTLYLSVNISKTDTYTKQARSRTLLQATPYFPQVQFISIKELNWTISFMIRSDVANNTFVKKNESKADISREIDLKLILKMKTIILKETSLLLLRLLRKMTLVEIFLMQSMI